MPELVSNVLNDVWSRLDHIVTSFGGWIDKHIGDAVMALWGAESSNENDPEQAVRAGLELQRRRCRAERLDWATTRHAGRDLHRSGLAR